MQDSPCLRSIRSRNLTAPVRVRSLGVGVVHRGLTTGNQRAQDVSCRLQMGIGWWAAFAARLFAVDSRVVMTLLQQPTLDQVVDYQSVNRVVAKCASATSSIGDPVLVENIPNGSPPGA